MINGLDISRWQGDVDFERAWQAGVRFVMIKCSEGSSWIDPKFTDFYERAKSVGMAVGAYHWYRPLSASAQMTIIQEAIGDRKLDFPLALDVEYHHNAKPDLYTSYLQQLVNKLSGFGGFEWPMIYTRASFWDSYVLSWSGWRQLPLWVAHWKTTKPTLPRDWNTWHIWQYDVDVGENWGAESRQVDVDYWNEAFPFPGTVPVPEPPPPEPPPPEPPPGNLTPPAEPAVIKITPTSTIESWINLRSYPSTQNSQNIIGRVYPGERWEYLGYEADEYGRGYWYIVRNRQQKKIGYAAGIWLGNRWLEPVVS